MSRTHRGVRLVTTVALLTVFAAALVWYFASEFSDLPGMLAFGAMTLLTILSIAWRSQDKRGSGAQGGVPEGP